VYSLGISQTFKVYSGRMGKTKAPPAKKIAFKTKDGKEIAFKSTGGHGKQSVRVKQLEKRLSAMEKAVLKYNDAVQSNKAKKEQQRASGERADGAGASKADKQTKGSKDAAVIERVGAAKAKM
jgi:hypothetical protein